MLSEVPEGWNAISFEQLARLQSGFPFKSAYFVDDESAGLPIIRIRDLETQSPVKFYDGEVPKEYIVGKGDVLIGMDGDFNCVEWNAENGALNQRVLRVYETDKAVRKFLLYRLRPLLKDLEGQISGTTVKHLSIKHLKGLTIPTPPLNEQHRIAEVLSSVDESIRATQAVIDQAERVKQGLMEKLLTGGLGSAAIEQGEVPEDWQSLKLGDLCEVLDRFRVPLNSEERQLRKGVIPYWGANGILDYVDEAIFEEPLLLIPEDGGPFAEYKDKPICYKIDEPVWVNNHAHVLRVTTNSREYLYQWFVHRDITAFVGGGTRAKLNQSALRELPVLLPPLNQQERIADILASVDDFVAKHRAVIEQNRRIKRGLMDDLLTGKVRTV